MRTILFWLACASCLAAQSYIIDQTANGSPGTGRTEGGEMQAQRVWIAPQMLKIAETEGDEVASIVRLDLGKLYLQFPKHKLYKVRDLADLTNKFERAARREDLRQKILAMSALSESDQDALLAENGLRRDGSTVAELKRLGRRRDIATHPTEGVEIYENGIKLATLWIADLPRPDSLFGAYTAISSFSDEVEAELRNIEGFPLEMELRLDSGERMSFTLKAEAHGVNGGVDIPPAEFDVPADHVQIAWDAPLPSDHHSCDICGNEVPAGERQFRGAWVCSGACKLKHIKALAGSGE